MAPSEIRTLAESNGVEIVEYPAMFTGTDYGWTASAQAFIVGPNAEPFHMGIASHNDPAMAVVHAIENVVEDAAMNDVDVEWALAAMPGHSWRFVITAPWKRPR